ncbi:MAG: helix-turn-helix domain-containing protein [Tannerellaceae bacterium]|nr:helix-turn-helix domain-containing protein [Tannerellaceae bacterium]
MITFKKIIYTFLPRKGAKNFSSQDKGAIMQNNGRLIYENTIKEFILGILFLITANYIIGILLYNSYPSVIKQTIFIGIVLNLISIIVIYNIPLYYMKKLLFIYLIVLTGLLFVNSVFVMMILPTVIPIVYYIVIPTTLYVIYPWKDVVKWSLLFLLLMLISCISSYLLNYHFREMPYENYFKYLSADSPFHTMMLPDIIAVFFCFLVICRSTYYLHLIHEIKVQKLINQETTATDKAKKSERLEIEDIKYEKIYRQIVEYFESKQPYLRPDFTLVNMANDLNINTAYLSKVINIKRNMNFNQFVNFYRISKVKEMIRDNPHYTLQHIYLTSGFNSQSSFNKAFKLQEKITPSEYANKINNPEGVS